MSSALDKALDEIVQDKTSNGGNRRPNQRRRGGNFRSRSSGPRDGVSKSSRGARDPGRGNWAHDKYDESDHSSSHRDRRDRGRRGDGGPPRGSTKIRVEQLHYDIGEKDLNDVFSRVGNIVKLEILYDRAGRSEGVAYVTYSNEQEAELAIDQFDGANAHGQPISVKLAHPRGGRGGGGGGGGFGNDSNPLFDRIKPRDGGGDAAADEESRRAKRTVAELRENAQTLNIDRYIPGDRGNSRDRRSNPRRGGGGGGGRGNERERRGGGRDRERRAGSAGASAGGESRRGGGGGGGGSGSARPKKTVEELDAEMNSYWGAPADTGAAAAPTEGSAPAAAAENPPAQQQQQQQQAADVPSTNVTNFDEEMTDL